jgi:Domain of unknown function (DUF4440)
MFSVRLITPLLVIVVALMCIDQVFCQTLPLDVSGKWVGALDVVHSDGSVEPDQAFLSLAVNNGTVSGAAGNSPDHQTPITTGRVTNNKLTFEILLGPGRVVKFDLTLDLDHMHGTASGLPVEDGSQIIVDVHRANSAWHSSATVTHVPDRLFQTIAALDEKLFDAYNHCDLATMGTLVTDDLEFYHDKTGLSVGKQVFLESIQNNICGKTQRELIPGSMEVYRLDHYGAVEIGQHRFRHPAHEELGVGEAKFITLWRYKDGNWQITREISYDHGAAKMDSSGITSVPH